MNVHLIHQATPDREVSICRALDAVFMKPAAVHHLENEIDHKSVRGERKVVTSEWDRITMSTISSVGSGAVFVRHNNIDNADTNGFTPRGRIGTGVSVTPQFLGSSPSVGSGVNDAPLPESLWRMLEGMQSLIEDGSGSQNGDAGGTGSGMTYDTDPSGPAIGSDDGIGSGVSWSPANASPYDPYRVDQNDEAGGIGTGVSYGTDPSGSAIGSDDGIGSGVSWGPANASPYDPYRGDQNDEAGGIGTGVSYGTDPSGPAIGSDDGIGSGASWSPANASPYDPYRVDQNGQAGGIGTGVSYGTDPSGTAIGRNDGIGSGVSWSPTDASMYDPYRDAAKARG